MKKLKRGIALALCLILTLSVCCVGASAKTSAGGQSVETVFFYVTNRDGQQVLLSQLPVSEMEKDMDAGAADGTLHNYVVLDHYVTPLHQEAQGFTVNELLNYAQSKSAVPALQTAPLTFEGNDAIAFWEMEQDGYDEADTYTYNQLYGVQRYNFPLLYEYWNYQTQDYYDPAGKLTRDEVIDLIFENAQPEYFVLGVRTFSQRYMITREKFSTGDYNMEDYWSSQDKLDNERALRMMVGMTKDDLYNAAETASDTRYWVQSIRLDMASRPDIPALDDISAPTGVMYQGTDGDYYVTLSCESEGAAIYYNNSYGSSGYMPTARYDGTLRVPADYVKNGILTLNVRAVKDGCTDAGVVTLKLTSSGTVEGEQNRFSDIASYDWYYDAVNYVAEKGLYLGTSDTTFSPDDTMSRAMFVTVMSRLEGVDVGGYTAAAFSDVLPAAWYFNYVNWASAAGIVNGVGDGKFSPNTDISLEAMVLVLYRHSGETADADAPLPGAVGAVSGWAEEAMRWAGARGLFDGVGGTLSAGGGATRAQVAAILMNYTARSRA